MQPRACARKKTDKKECRAEQYSICGDDGAMASSQQLLNSIIVHDLDLEISFVQREVDKISHGATLCEPSGRDDVRILITDLNDISLLSASFASRGYRISEPPTPSSSQLDVSREGVNVSRRSSAAVETEPSTSFSRRGVLPDEGGDAWRDSLASIPDSMGAPSRPLSQQMHPQNLISAKEDLQLLDSISQRFNAALAPPMPSDFTRPAVSRSSVRDLSSIGRLPENHPMASPPLSARDSNRQSGNDYRQWVLAQALSTCLETCRGLLEEASKDVMAEVGNESARGKRFASKSTVGMTLLGCKVEHTIIGGPVSSSISSPKRMLSKLDHLKPLFQSCPSR